jgi:hypothetical protein
MTHPFDFRFLSLVWVLLFLMASLVWAKDPAKDLATLKREYSLSGVRAITADIEVSVGKVVIEKAARGQAFAGFFRYSGEPPEVEYAVSGEKGLLDVRFGDKSIVRKKHRGSGDEDYDIDLGDFEDWECRLAFSSEVPLSLGIEAAVVSGEWDLGGFQVEALSLETGVNKLDIDFSSSNPVEMNRLDIESGVGKLTMRGLGNANFRDLSFQGGVGSYELYFDGKFSDDARADLEIGMGKLVLHLPENIGVRIRMDDSFLSSITMTDMEKRDGSYINQHWGSNRPQLDMQIDTGVAKVEIDWLR